MDIILQERKELILKILVNEYISKAIPVSSEAISKNYSLGLSSATVRNELAILEESGYVVKPHTSAGSIPTDKGYRYFVESLLDIKEIPSEEQTRIRKSFRQEKREVDELFHLAATLLASLSQYFALVTLPKAPGSRLKHVEILLIRDCIALTILVLDQARLMQQLITFDYPVTQKELSLAAEKFNNNCAGMTVAEIVKNRFEPNHLEGQILPIILSLMEAGANLEFSEACVDGIRHILDHPELAKNEKTKTLLEMVERKTLEKEILPRLSTKLGIQVIIGDENPEDAMKHCSVIISRYGVPGEIGGIIGLLGPTRMNYGWAIPITRLLASILSEFTVEIYGTHNLPKIKRNISN